MTSVGPSAAQAAATATPVVPRILCGVNGGRPARQAMLRALELASDGAGVHFVGVCDTRGVGTTETAEVGEHRAEQALAIAHEAARDAGIRATTELVHDTDPRRRLIAMATDHDPLVVGSGGKAGLKALGSVSERVAMRARCSVLIVRPGAPRQS